MENTQGLIDWGLANASRLGLHVTRVEWIDEWLPGYSDYQIKLEHGGAIYTGRGIGNTEPLAFAKGLAEALERLALSFRENPWAAAAYYDTEGASLRAYRELLGIDRALCHHFCGHKPRQLPSAELRLLPAADRVEKMLKKHSLELGIYELRPTADARICAAFMWSKDSKGGVPGFVAGYGCDADLESAATHAFVECARSAVAVFLGKASPPEEELIKRPGNPRWHFWQARTAEGLKHLRETFLPHQGEVVQLSTENISIKDVNFTEVETLRGTFPDLPLRFVQASSDRLLKPQFGEFQGDTATMRRLGEFNGGPVVVNTTAPHFYG